ncbi:hypothetical protein CEUSTIGMA_g5029.t1 [Chlamydomonas eustigma]|uniref:Carboxypeptidase n=1 Tax=Chlamydomonas eustigma TaxID=1157962 RepID=A0A250X3E2_9CHLO|nr:hypothetical protein CEUSTIGMA_g5029.t1 [Chlamydomonas eustigma]|eukprot:GAX77585.1 hypothetical protein CEUSTIGMA_g5029.t1 [Chlamydomonas eustigma]
MATLVIASLAQGLNPSVLQLRLSQDPKPTFSGYLKVDEMGSELYYAYWEAGEKAISGETPIVLWLQGGPGCASTFGGFYELGPYQLNKGLGLVNNSGSWARNNGLLLIDQPLGTGYSQPALNDSIPTDELGMAHHLFTALQEFFLKHSGLSARPLFITGESYGGKYVPSIAHYILQAKDMSETRRWTPTAWSSHVSSIKM